MTPSIQDPKSKIQGLSRPTWAEIDLSASVYNIRRIRSLLAPNVKVLAMIKAEAYGHGMAGVARAAELAGAAMLGFAALSEAVVEQCLAPQTRRRVDAGLAGCKTIANPDDQQIKLYAHPEWQPEPVQVSPVTTRTFDVTVTLSAALPAGFTTIFLSKSFSYLFYRRIMPLPNL